jgi:hypothetical protein
LKRFLAKRELDRFAQETTRLAAFEKRWASFLAGSLNSQVPVVAPPRALGVEQRPTMAELASLCFRLPPWLRTGRGWMVGGSYTQAAGFGAGALLDDEPFGEKIDPSAVIRDGDQLQSLLQQLSESPSTAERARELVNQPAINWPDAKQFFERAGLWRRQRPEMTPNSAKSCQKTACSPRRFSLPPIRMRWKRPLTKRGSVPIKRAPSSSPDAASVQRVFREPWFLISMPIHSASQLDAESVPPLFLSTSNFLPTSAWRSANVK